MRADPKERRFVNEAGKPSVREARRHVYAVLVTALERDLGMRDGGLILGGLGQHDERLARKAAAKLVEEFKRKAGT